LIVCIGLRGHATLFLEVVSFGLYKYIFNYYALLELDKEEEEEKNEANGKQSKAKKASPKTQKIKFYDVDLVMMGAVVVVVVPKIVKWCSHTRSRTKESILTYRISRTITIHTHATNYNREEGS